MVKSRIPQTDCGMPTIDSAPKDGSEIYSFDGKWWRRQTRWRHELGQSCLLEQFRSPKRWIAFGFLPINPTHWCAPGDATEEVMAMIYEGLRPA